MILYICGKQKKSLLEMAGDKLVDSKQAECGPEAQGKTLLGGRITQRQNHKEIRNHKVMREA